MSEFRIDVYRQAVSWANPSVRITHIPTGLVTSCAATQSECVNRDEAVAEMRELLAMRREHDAMAESLGECGTDK